jgi:hypothetical protein
MDPETLQPFFTEQAYEFPGKGSKQNSGESHRHGATACFIWAARVDLDHTSGLDAGTGCARIRLDAGT